MFSIKRTPAKKSPVKRTSTKKSTVKSVPKKTPVKSVPKKTPVKSVPKKTLTTLEKALIASILGAGVIGAGTGAYVKRDKISSAAKGFKFPEYLKSAATKKKEADAKKAVDKQQFLTADF